ncbi:MAG: DNA-deoxyinosine glycosylase [Methylophaga sp.]|nr:DNA-deoxyinosine glycosylase [Methylophaga sp.]
MVTAISKITVETGFPPIADKNAQILILGSMPSVKSLQQQQYYAHPRNAFWPIMSALLGMDKEWGYQQRCDHLRKNHIAVWDALKVCQRQGSLDSNIETSSMIANDFNAFFQQHPKIGQILFNGGKAEQVFKQYVIPNLDKQFRHITQMRLPSTSPAHAAMTLEQKLHSWRLIKPS